MSDNNYTCTPIELYKLCANIIVKDLYDKNEYKFCLNLNKLNLTEDIYEILIDRYRVIKHILNN